MEIAVIDDGVDACRLVHPKRVVQDLVVESSGVVRIRRTEDFFQALHGTRCAQIIEAYTEKVKFISICIFDRATLKADCTKLVAALKWCLEQGIQLIHMSIGTRLLADYGDLRWMTAGLVRRGSLIVAAGSNAGTFTMPACLGGVLGVAADPRLTGDVYEYHEFLNGIQIAASSVHTFSEEKDPFLSSVANSYAAPTVTAAICRRLTDEEEKQEGGQFYVARMFKNLLPGKHYRTLRPDFVEEALILNLSGAELFKELFFFSCIEVANIAEFCLSDQKCCIVFLPGKDKHQNEEVVDFIRQHQRQFYGLVYGGKYLTGSGERPRLEELSEEILLWQEQDCGMAGWDQRREIRGEHAPCVLIQTTQGEGMRLACELQRQFREMGYQCVAASNWDYAYLYGLEFIPSGIKRSQVAEYLEEIFTPDLVILLDREGGNWELEEDAVYHIKEEEFGRKGICEEIVAYFSQ